MSTSDMSTSDICGSPIDGPRSDTSGSLPDRIALVRAAIARIESWSLDDELSSAEMLGRIAEIESTRRSVEALQADLVRELQRR